MDRIEPERRPPFGEHARVQSRGEETHRRILVAALEAFDELGYKATSVDAIAARAGCSRPTFYQYFAGKQVLFRRVADRLGAELTDRAAKLPPIDGGLAGRRALAAWIRDLVDLHDLYAPIFRTFEVPVQRDDRMAIAAQRVMQRSGAVFASAFREAPATVAAPDGFAALVLYTLTRACGLRVGRKPAIDPERWSEGLADWAHRCFYGPVKGVNTGPAGGDHSVGRASRPELIAVDSERDRRGGTRARQTRDRLLVAAAAVFEELGYESARIDDIAAAAGLSHGAFYRYFDGKQAAFSELSRPLLEEMSKLLRELPEPETDLADWVRRWYRTYALHGSHFSSWPGPRGADAELAGRVLAHVSSMLRSSCAYRAYGDVDVDSVLFVAHVEHGPFMTRIYPEFPVSEAVAATTTILARAFFGAREFETMANGCPGAAGAAIKEK